MSTHIGLLLALPNQPLSHFRLRGIFLLYRNASAAGHRFAPPTARTATATFLSIPPLRILRNAITATAAGHRSAHRNASATGPLGRGPSLRSANASGGHLFLIFFYQ